MSIGLRILKRQRKVDATMVAKYRELPVANISDSMNRMTAGGSRLRPMHAGGVMCGPALTVKTRPGDNLMVHKALDLAEAGDIVVVDAGGDLTNSLIGELMLAVAAGTIPSSSPVTSAPTRMVVNRASPAAAVPG